MAFFSFASGKITSVETSYLPTYLLTYIHTYIHSRSRCSNCHGRHRSSICDPTETAVSPISTENQQRKSAVKEKRATSSVNMCVWVQRTLYSCRRQDNCINPGNNHQKMTIGIILDRGDQGPYVPERVRDALNLPFSHPESLTMRPLVPALEIIDRAE